jgi:hypothetical protein
VCGGKWAEEGLRAYETPMRPALLDTDPAQVEDASPLPFKLRYVALVLGLLAISAQAAPRMSAAFRLHSAATTFADYALCMVGPTGPSLLRDNPPEFRKLVRRRLIATTADDQPFARCAKAARDVTESPEVERAHRAAAASFTEYGADPRAEASGDAVRTLDSLSVTTKRLGELSDAAWPFVRGGYTSLVKASAYAPEAAHPADFPRPGKARGVVSPASITRCVPPGTAISYALALSPDKRTKIVRSTTPEGVETDATLAPADARVFAVSCDARGAVVAAGREGTRDVNLYSCGYLGECHELRMPRLGAMVPRYPLDVAKVDGVIVVSVPMHGIVRVASSRDEGRSWTPFIVAYDPEAHPELRFDVKTVDRIKVAGRRLLLVGSGRRESDTFPALASDDAGASWRAP